MKTFSLWCGVCLGIWMGGVSSLQAMEPAELAATLRNPDVSHYAKTLACKAVAQTGTAAYVPVLIEFLGDAQLSHLVQIAFLQIPGPEVDAALQEALKTVPDKAIVAGIIQVLGQRKGTSAVPAILPLLKDEDYRVVRAAAEYLVRSGVPEASRAVLEAWRAAEISWKQETAFAIFLLAEKEPERYAELRQTDGLLHTQRSAAQAGEIGTADETRRYELFREAFLAPEAFRNIGAKQAADSLTSNQILEIFQAVWDSCDEAKRLFILGYLRQKKLVQAADWVLSRTEPTLRSAQLETLGAIGSGNEKVADYLVQQVTANVEEPERLAQTLSALKLVEAERLNTILPGLLEKYAGKAGFLLGLAAQQNLPGIRETLLSEMNTSDAENRTLAVRAMADIMTCDDLKTLGALLPGKPEPVRNALLGVLVQIVSQSPDKEAAAGKVSSVVGQFPAEFAWVPYDLFLSCDSYVAQKFLYDQLTNPSEAGEVVRVLGRWPSARVDWVVGHAAATLPDENLRSRAARGYIRLIRQMPMLEEVRMGMVTWIWPYLQRDEDKVLLLEATSRLVGQQEAYKFVVPFLDDPKFLEPAAKSLLAICAKLDLSKPEIRATLEKIETKTTVDATRTAARDLLQGIVTRR